MLLAAPLQSTLASWILSQEPVSSHVSSHADCAPIMMIMKPQVEEELDSEREFWYDPAAGDLYYVLNTTAGPPSTSHGSFELAELKTLFELKGTQESPVTDVVFSVRKRRV